MPVIAIDGPAGSGKSTIARALAARLDVPHIDTGAYYRAVTLAALRAGIDLSDPGQLTALTGRITLRRVNGRTMLDGEDVEEEIRTTTVDEVVSVVAACRSVRSDLVDRQRAALSTRGGVVEGRDAGTNIVPAADLKVWLTATPEVRAQRRADDLSRASGVPVTLQSLAQQVQALGERDRRDAANMAQADDVREVDTTGLTVDQVVAQIVDLLPQPPVGPPPSEERTP